MLSIVRLLFMIMFFSLLCGNVNGQKIKGITVVAPPSEYREDPMKPLLDIHADYVKVVPYGFTRSGGTTLVYDMEGQWWGERTEGVVETIRLAKKSGLSVMLKPQIYIPGSWIGDLDFESNEEWEAWEENYRSFIFHYMQIAIDEEVEIFCFGTENKMSIQKRPQFWVQLIKEIRAKYCGLITYCSNWDAYKKVQFWPMLDYIGVSSYFPLSEDKTPSVNKLVKAWQPIVSSMKSYSEQQGVPILFTEYGYLSVDGCAGKTWELEKKVKKLSINQQAQANALAALYEAFGKEDFWAGGFLWKWFPESMGHEGYPERDYTPQDKIGLKVIKENFESDYQ